MKPKTAELQRLKGPNQPDGGSASWLAMGRIGGHNSV